ncbi:MAG: hypothetical protein CML55_10240 [Rhodobacteraceae bacterium]|nr:hypothetical protein [Paracoccaceae bacterium]
MTQAHHRLLFFKLSGPNPARQKLPAIPLKGALPERQCKVTGAHGLLPLFAPEAGFFNAIVDFDRGD